MTAFLIPGLFLLAAPPSVHPGGASLRDQCVPEAAVVARLEPGIPVTIRFAMNGELGACYKVQAGEHTGYLLASELTGLESFEQARNRGNDRSLPQMIRAEIGRIKEEAGLDNSGGPVRLSGSVTPPVANAIRLLESSQPRQALEELEAQLSRGGRDPFVLTLAGLAAYQSDDPRRAVEYWQTSVNLRPNAAIEALLKKAQRELAADTSRAKVHGNRFLLRYNEGELNRAQADALMEALEDEYRRIDAGLGCPLPEKVTVVVMLQDAYLATTGAAEWSGGQYDGRIRAVLTREGITPRVRQTFAHEITHACLAAQGTFPAWFHEGMAQRWSGERPDTQARAAVRARLRSRQLPSLNNLSRTFTQMSAEHAALAYAYSWEAVDTIYRLQGDQMVRNLLRSPESLPSLADQISRALAQ
jgi:hypothetical protein